MVPHALRVLSLRCRGVGVARELHGIFAMHKRAQMIQPALTHENAIYTRWMAVAISSKILRAARTLHDVSRCASHELHLAAKTRYRLAKTHTLIGGLNVVAHPSGLRARARVLCMRRTSEGYTRPARAPRPTSDL
jgi:hypothetical protein